MQLLIQQPYELGGKTICIDVQSNHTLDDLKQKINDKCAIPTCLQLLIFKSKLLQPDESYISSHGLYPSALIQLRINKNTSTTQKNEISSNTNTNDNKKRVIVTGAATILTIKNLIKKQHNIDILEVRFHNKTLFNNEDLKQFGLATEDFSEYYLNYTLSPHKSKKMNIIIHSVEEYIFENKTEQKEDIITDISDKYLPTSNRNRLLIYGYIHSAYIDNDNKWNMVCMDVMNLCHKYFHESLNMFLLTSKFNMYTQSSGMYEYKWSCFNVNDSKHVRFDIYDMDNPNVLWSDNSLTKNDSVVIVDDILLPDKLQKKLNKFIKPHNYFGREFENKSNEGLSVMFQIQSANICYGVAFDYFNNIYSNKTKINGYKFQLPYLDDMNNSQTKCHALYSNHFGLMVLFENQHLYNLPLNFEDIDSDIDSDKYEWKWKLLSNEQKDLKKCVKPLIVNNQDLFVMDKAGKCSMFDFWGKTWKQLKPSLFPHRFSGSYCDQHRIYIGGGCRSRSRNKIASKTVEYYNVYKDEWKKLPETRYEHKWYPTLWKTQNLLFIASSDEFNFNDSEFLDVRIGKIWQSGNCQTFNFKQNIKLDLGQMISRFVPLNIN